MKLKEKLVRLWLTEISARLWRTNFF